MKEQDRYASAIFMYCVLPLLKVVIESDEKRKKSFMKMTGTFQVSFLEEGKKIGVHYQINKGEFTFMKELAPKPTLEFEFKTVEAFIAFFKGTSKKLPKIKGVRNIKLLVRILGSLLKMAGLMGLSEPPKSEADKRLLVKLFFYLLSSGISQLNKQGHPEIAKWAQKSPDRVYAWAVAKEEELSAYIHVKAGKSKSKRGTYTRSKPFFTMRFDNPDSALGILMELDDMIDSTAKGKLMMEGAPEFGAQLGEYMKIVGAYAK